MESALRRFGILTSDLLSWEIQTIDVLTVMSAARTPCQDAKTRTVNTDARRNAAFRSLDGKKCDSWSQARFPEFPGTKISQHNIQSDIA